MPVNRRRKGFEFRKKSKVRFDLTNRRMGGAVSNSRELLPSDPLLRFESATQAYSWRQRRPGIHCAAREINLGSIKLHKGKKTEICNWMASPERLSAARRRGCCRNESSRQSAAVEEWRAYSAGGGECFAPKLPMTAFAAPACKPCRNQAPAVSRPETGP